MLHDKCAKKNNEKSTSLLQGKNSKRHGVTPYVAHTHNRRLREKLFVKLATQNNFLYYFNVS